MTIEANNSPFVGAEGKVDGNQGLASGNLNNSRFPEAVDHAAESFFRIRTALDIAGLGQGPVDLIDLASVSRMDGGE